MARRRVLWRESANVNYGPGWKRITRSLVKALGPRTSARSRAETTWPVRRRRTARRSWSTVRRRS